MALDSTVHDLVRAALGDDRPVTATAVKALERDLDTRVAADFRGRTPADLEAALVASLLAKTASGLTTTLRARARAALLAGLKKGMMRGR